VRCLIDSYARNKLSIKLLRFWKFHHQEQLFNHAWFTYMHHFVPRTLFSRNEINKSKL
jgi:hypothetical protein